MYKNMKYSILVVDDNLSILELIRKILTLNSFKVFVATNVKDAINILESTEIHLVITDQQLPDILGTELIKHINQNYKKTKIIMMSGYASISDAVNAIKNGAQEYIKKPFKPDELLELINKYINEIHLTSDELTNIDPFTDNFIGNSKNMKSIFNIIKKTAKTDAVVLITGENGTGKELVANAIHSFSNRNSYPFLPINCGSIPKDLLESELFGHIKGSFTGAENERIGYFESAENGTIFLDEISETSLSMQVKLLRVIQNSEITKVGSSQIHKINCRVIAATNKNLFEIVKDGNFREDLYYRLNVINIEIPPLRDRKDDILPLLEHFNNKFSKLYKKNPLRFTHRTIELLLNYHWPGNVREFENLIQRLTILTDGEEIDASDLPSLMRFSISNSSSIFKTIAEVELEHILKVLSNVDGNKSKAAKILGIDRKTLREKLKKANQ